jgi:23S rRNA (pseudouridine1915-N3)-methyltransferase
MRATILCVGRLDREYQGVWKHYENLLRPYVTLEVLEVVECPLALGEVQARAKEGAALLNLFRKGAYSVAVDMRGREFSSEGLSEFLAGKKVEGQHHFQFVVGGASGLDSRVLDATQLSWSLSPLTFPHQMARCIVVEQLYRAIKIERGEPYHH